MFKDPKRGREAYQLQGNPTNNPEDVWNKQKVRQDEKKAERFLPGSGRPPEPVFCRAARGQWQDPEGDFLSSPPKRQIWEFSLTAGRATADRRVKKQGL